MEKEMTNQDKKYLSLCLRQDVLNMICKAKTGHIGGDFSVMDVLVELYFNQMNICPRREVMSRRK